ncbi:MAG: hypothetical protein J6M62_09515 [Selenomonadaceae bacterium]|nr:hypothetical protein [Selenomonadaceae bacterium]MBP3722782.1 hypothetical protein [Selenomonadaceae bacterium]
MLVTHYIDFSKPMPDHVAKELENLKDAPITFDEDCPPLTEKQMKDYFQELLKKKGYVKKEVAAS